MRYLVIRYRLIAGQRSDISTRQEITRELGLIGRYMFSSFIMLMICLSYQYTNPQKKMSKSTATRKIMRFKSSCTCIKVALLRRSFQTNKKVTEIIYDNIYRHIVAGFSAMVFASIVGILLGDYCCATTKYLYDHLIISFSVFGISIPSFVSAIIIAMIFGFYLSDITGLNLTGQLWVNHPIRGRELQLQNLILPALTLGIRPLAIIVQLTRSSMLEVLSMDYIRTAYAKGLTKYQVVFKHALKNALNPVITAVSGWLASLMAGAFFVEYIFDWKGLGYTTIKAVQSLDFPVVMGITLLVATIFVVINIFVDLLYAAVDPRIRLS
jgi:ABC-type dipeptide/oligopeptide/nickel transport system permease component